MKTSEPELIPIAHPEDCPPGSSIEVVAGKRILALFNVDGVFYVLDGVCPHQGGPLGKGALNGHIVTCPWHGWQFDVRTGTQQINPTLCQPRLTAWVQDGQVVVRRQDLEIMDG